MLDDLSLLGEYLSEFAAQPATPTKLDLANDKGGLLTVKGLQHALNKLGFKGANGRALGEDGAWGKNTEGALLAYIAKNRARFGNPQYKWQGKTSPQRVFLFPNAMLDELIIAAGAASADTRGPQPTAATKTPAAVPSAKAPAGGKTISVLAAQDILNKLGAKLTKDGKFGPKTAAAWAQAASSRGLDSTFARIAATQASVVPATYDALLAASVKKGGAAPATPSVAAAEVAPGQMKVSVGEAQDILNRLGAKLKRDGLFGPSTARQWGVSAKKRGQDGTFKRIDGMNAMVSSAAYAALSQASGALPGAAVPPSAQTEKISVARAQELLNKRGAKLTADGLFGPKTAAAWAAQARAGNQDPTFQRVDGRTALVSSGALAALLKAGSAPAPVKPSPVKPKPGPKPKPAPAPKPGPEPKPAAGGVQISVANAQSLLNARGAKLKLDGLYGPNTKKAWAAQAQKLKTSPLFERVDGKTARVDPNTLAKISGQAAPAPAPAPKPEPEKGALSPAELNVAKALIGKATTSTSVKIVQEALLEANATPGRTQGAFVTVRDTGVWDSATQSGFLSLFKRDSDQGKRIYAVVFRSTLAKDKKSIKLEKDDAATLGELARRWKARPKDAKKPAKPDAKKPAGDAVAKLKAEAKKVAATFKSFVSVALLQHAILQMLSQQKAGKLPGPQLPSVKVSGKWDSNTQKGLMLGWGSYLWSGKGASEIEKYLLPLIVVNSKPAGSGFAAITGSYVLLPATIAANVQSIAATHIASTKKDGGKKPVISAGPATGGGTAPVVGPQQNVNGQVPAQQPPINAPGVEPVDQPAPGVPVVSPAIPNISINAQGGSSSDSGGAIVPAGGGGGDMMPAPAAPGADAPAPAPAPESQPAPASSSGAGTLLFGAAAVAAGLFFLSKGKKTSPNDTPTVRMRTG